jgi:hypothetical protein
VLQHCVGPAGSADGSDGAEGTGEGFVAAATEDEVRASARPQPQAKPAVHHEPAGPDEECRDARDGGHPERPTRAERVGDRTHQRRTDRGAPHEDRHVERHHAPAHRLIGGGLHRSVGSGHQDLP